MTCNVFMTGAHALTSVAEPEKCMIDMCQHVLYLHDIDIDRDIDRGIDIDIDRRIDIDRDSDRE